MTKTAIQVFFERLIGSIIVGIIAMLFIIPSAYVFGVLIKCAVKLFSYGFNLWT